VCKPLSSDAAADAVGRASSAKRLPPGLDIEAPSRFRAVETTDFYGLRNRRIMSTMTS